MTTKINTTAKNRNPIVYAVGFWIVVLIGIGLIAEFMIMPLLAGQFRFTNTVPAVVGKSAAEAEKILQDAELDYAWDTVGSYSAEIPEGFIMAQVPVAGREVKTNRKIYLVKSLGLRQFIIPELRGKSIHQAQVTLRRMGFVEGKTKKEAHVSIPRGVVINTNPKAGLQARAGDTVDIIISQGSSGARLELPDLTGLTFTDAVNIIDSLGYQLGKVDRVTGTKGQKSETVISTKTSGSNIHLVVVD